MPHDPLETIMKLRRQAVDECRQMLAQSLASAEAARTVAGAAERAIADETELAMDLTAGDGMVEAFAAWLPGARHLLHEARTRQDYAEAEVARRRAELAACRTALETIVQLRASRRAVATAERALRQQHEVDEAAARPRHHDD